MITKFKDFLYKRQQYLGMLIVFLFLSLIAFRFDDKNVRMLWYNKPSVAIILAMIIGLSVMVWLQIEKRKTSQLLTKIKLGISLEKNEGKTKFSELSARQQQVLLLIMEGKANKEIMASLHIEQSTLKTHINQIYRIMEIQNRREAKNIDKQLLTSK